MTMPVNKELKGTDIYTDKW